MAVIKDVAETAGLSVSVVSKYLKNPDSVRPDTKTRIEKAIKELNYEENQLSFRLQSKKKFK